MPDIIRLGNTATSIITAFDYHCTYTFPWQAHLINYAHTTLYLVIYLISRLVYTFPLLDIQFYVFVPLIKKCSGWFNKKMSSYQHPIVEIRQYYDRLISAMGFPILVRHLLYIESRPWWWSQPTAQLLWCLEELIEVMAVTSPSHKCHPDREMTKSRITFASLCCHSYDQKWFTNFSSITQITIYKEMLSSQMFYTM